MDYIREFDIRLEKEMYYAGETLSGVVILDTSENFKVRAIRVLLRGKAHTEWKVMVSGDRRTVKDDQYFIDDRALIWGKEKAEGTMPILPRGMHQFPFRFQLPESSLPCSFESRAGTIRYYLKVTVDIPYASPPQGMKYFTIIGPHIDCMDYLRPIRGESKRRRCCWCCESGRVSLRTDFERSAYVCGESLRVKADIDNQSEEEVRLKLRLVQYVEYYIDRGVLGVQKEVSNTILEYRGAPVTPHSRTKWDSQQHIVVPTMPPTMVGVCRLIQIYYLLKVNIDLEKSGEDLHMHFPFTIATVPFRIPNSNQQPNITYEVACDHAEGGMYIGPEFLLGQVYDGTSEFGESIVLYRPVYPTVKSTTSSCTKTTTTTNNSSSQPQTPNATKGLTVQVKGEPATQLQLQIQPQTHQYRPQSQSVSTPTTSTPTTATTTTTTVTTTTGSSIPIQTQPKPSTSSMAMAEASKNAPSSSKTTKSTKKVQLQSSMSTSSTGSGGGQGVESGGGESSRKARISSSSSGQKSSLKSKKPVSGDGDVDVDIEKVGVEVDVDIRSSSSRTSASNSNSNSKQTKSEDEKSVQSRDRAEKPVYPGKVVSVNLDSPTTTSTTTEPGPGGSALRESPSPKIKS